MPAFVKNAVESGKMTPTAALVFNTKAYKKTDKEGVETFDVDKIRATFKEMSEAAKAKGDKIKVGTAKATKEGTNTRVSYDAMRKIAANKETPEVFALLLQVLTGDVEIEAARLRAGDELDWFVLPTKEVKGKKVAKAPKAATEKGKGKKNAKAPKAVEETIDDDVPTVSEDDMDELFNLDVD
jgi:hypothetical protein